MLSPEEVKTRARRIVEEVFNQGDLAVAHELLSPDCVHHGPGQPPPPGLGAVRDHVARLRRAFPDLHGIVEDEIAEGDRVAQRITCRGTHDGHYLDIPPTGRQVCFEVFEINRVGPDGRFVEHWSSADLLGVLRQLGATPDRTPAAPDHTGGRP